MSKQPCPVVAIPACAVEIDGRSIHRVVEKYVSCVIDGAGCQPLLVPAVGEVGCFDEMVSRFDGIFLTGAASNVEPHHYSGTPSRSGTLHQNVFQTTSADRFYEKNGLNQTVAEWLTDLLAGKGTRIGSVQ